MSHVNGSLLRHHHAYALTGDARRGMFSPGSASGDGLPWLFTLRCTIVPATATTGRSSWARRSSACARRRIAAPRSLSYSLKVEPKEHFLNWQQDPHGNYLARLVFPEPHHALCGRGRPGRRDGGDQPVRLLSSSRPPKTFPFTYEPAAEEGSRALSRGERARPAPARAGSPSIPRAPEATVSTSWSSSTSSLQREIGYVIRMEPGIQTLRGDAGSCARGSCRDTAWLLVQILRQLRPRRAVRLRLPDPAQARRRRRSTARPAPSRTSPTCTPGPRSTCRAPAGSGSIRPRACSPARATSRSPARPTRRAPRRSPARSTRARSSSTSR